MRKKQIFVRDGKALYGDPASVPHGERIIPVHPNHIEMYEREFGVKIPRPKPMTDDERKEFLDAFEAWLTPPKDDTTSPPQKGEA